MTSQEKHSKLKEIAQEVSACQRCQLFKQATRGVPGEGNPEAKIMFIGEGPGYHEDQQGRPFVGQAGQLLNKLLSSIGLRREDVFIANVVKHRPSDNRDPLPEEIETCGHFLDKQISIIDPAVIVTLGRFSMNKFLPGEWISRAHGQSRFVDFMGKRLIVLPMYHPAAALRNGQIMSQLSDDFRKIKDFLSNDHGDDGQSPADKKEDDDVSQMALL